MVNDLFCYNREINATAFKLQQMHEMRPIAIDDSVAWCVCHAPELCKTAKRIKVLF